MRIGVYGGTFSPVHNGHIAMAKSFFEQLELDKLYVIPTFTPPHKNEVDGAGAYDRYEMLKLAFDGCDGIVVSDIEIKRANVSYTVDTLRELKDEGELFLLCGSDMFLTLETWREAAEIFRLAHIVLGRRENCDDTARALDKHKIFLEEKFGAQIHALDFSAIEISSSEIREHIRCGDCVHGYLPEAVENYIRAHKLYAPDITEEKLEEIRTRVSTMMSARRLSHTLGVEREIISLAKIFLPEKVNKLRAAALLHDITKEYPTQKQLEICKTYSIEVSDSLRRSPKLFHAVTGAYVARTLFEDVVDGEAFDAILYHTTGRRGMKLAEKLLYLADYIEDGRTFDDCVRLRKYFYDKINNLTATEKYTHLEKTLLLSFDMTVKNLRDEGACVDPVTLDAMDFIKSELEEALGRKISTEEL